MRRADIGHVSTNPGLFCSGQGVQFQDAPPELLEAPQSFLAMDAPRHTRLRRIVSAAFNVRAGPARPRPHRRAGADDRRRSYESGDRDADVFADPLRFDVMRDPDPHVGFGGGGPHSCLGNMLARTQLRQIFSQLLTRVPDLHVGEGEVLRSNFVHAVRSMPCSIGG